MPNDSAGIGDPYWYEWSIGLQYALRMLDPSAEIVGVTLQATELQGLDDVIVEYRDGHRRCVQVKHTREDDTLTFSDLLSGLLCSIAQAWKVATSGGQVCIPELVTNRAVGRRVWSSSSTGEMRPPLHEFWAHLKDELDRRASIADVEFSPDWQDAWKQWLAQLNGLSAGEQHTFLKALVLSTDAPGLADTEQLLVTQLSALFACTREQAQELLASLDHALRRWATTTRVSERITSEAVLAALQLPTESPGAHHLLPPPAPFFTSRMQLVEDLATRLQGRTSPVVMLSGGPGSGKTSVVSALANRREPVVDARFHAYRPIAPDTQHLPPDADLDVSPRGLWSALLSQLRHLLRGRWTAHRVPIRNKFLSSDTLRAEVLRLAEAVAVERGKTFTIAIDGIDHAARATASSARELLTSLPHPSLVPSHVSIVVAGQPPEAWAEYPLWLRAPTAGVDRVEVAPLTDADIGELVAERVGDVLGSPAITTRLVADASRGDTLAAVFAVEEAKLVATLEEFRIRLASRALHSGLQSYYEAIWNAATTRPGVAAQMGPRVAAVLALFDQRVSGEALAAIYRGGATALEWEEALLALRPLVVREAGGFRVTHNDVRVFLAALLSADPDRTKLFASAIADFCRDSAIAATSRFTLLFRVLQLAGRRAEIPRVFNAQYVADAWTAGASLELLISQGREALSEAMEQQGNWTGLHEVVCALIAIEQIDRSASYCNFSTDSAFEQVSSADGYPLPALLSECTVEPVAGWSSAVVSNALQDALALWTNGDRDRAIDLVRRWFGEVTPTQLARHVRAATESVDRAAADSVLKLYGRVSHTVCDDDWHDAQIADDNDEQRDWTCFYSGFLAGAAAADDVREWARALRAIRLYDLDHMEELLAELIVAERWIEAALALRRIAKSRHRFRAAFQAEAAAWSLLIGNVRLQKMWTEPVVVDSFALPRATDDEDDCAASAIATSFVVGWRTMRPLEGIRDDAVGSYGRTRARPEARSAVSFLSYVAALAGRWLGRPVDGPPLPVTAFAQVIERLLGSVPTFELHGVHQRFLKLLFRLLMFASARAGGEFEGAAAEACARYAQNRKYGPEAPFVWGVLRKLGRTDLLAAWLIARFGPDGNGWRQTTDERVAELGTLAGLVSQTPPLQPSARQLIELRRRVVLGYVNHKEYALGTPEAWFDALAEVEPAAWEGSGLRLLAINAEANVAGDNRASMDVEAAVSRAAVRCGPGALARLDQTRTRGGAFWFEADSQHWVAGIIGSLRRIPIAAEDLRAFWSVAVGRLSWMSRRDIGHLADTRMELQKVATRIGLDRELAALADATPLEWKYAVMSEARSTRSWVPFQRQLSDEEAVMRNALSGKSIDDALGELMARMETGCLDNCLSAAGMVVERLAEHVRERGDGQLWGLCLAALAARDADYPWHFDGVHTLLEKAAPHLSEEHAWQLVRTIGERVIRRPTWLMSANGDLDQLCRWRSTTPRELREGLERHLATHELWVAPGRRESLKFPVLAAPVKGMSSWRSYCVQQVLFGLSSDSGTLNCAAMRGLRALSLLVPPSIEEIAAGAASLERVDRAVIGALAEYLVCVVPDARARLKSLLEDYERSGCLELELQAWCARGAWARGSGDVPPRLSLGDVGTAAVPGRGRIVVEVPQLPAAARSATGRQAIVSVLEQLEVICGVESDEFEGMLLASLAADPVIEQAPRPRMRRRPDFIFSASSEMYRLYDVIRSSLPDASLDDSFALGLAQALLHVDEPHVLLGRLDRLEGPWPSDAEVGALVVGGRARLQQQCQDLLHVGVAEDEEVFAGLVHLTTRERDYFFYKVPLMRKAVGIIGARPHGTTLGARTFASYDVDRFEPDERNANLAWLAFKGRGLARTPMQGIGIVLSSRLQRDGGWAPSPTMPTEWVAGDGSPVRYERLFGPRRDEHRERLFRDPFLERWTCKRAAIAALEGQLGASVSLVSELEETPEEGYDPES